MHVLSCFTQLKSVLLICCVFWIFFQNAGSNSDSDFFFLILCATSETFQCQIIAWSDYPLHPYVQMILSHLLRSSCFVTLAERWWTNLSGLGGLCDCGCHCFAIPVTKKCSTAKLLLYALSGTETRTALFWFLCYNLFTFCGLLHQTHMFSLYCENTPQDRMSIKSRYSQVHLTMLATILQPLNVVVVSDFAWVDGKRHTSFYCGRGQITLVCKFFCHVE